MIFRLVNVLNTDVQVPAGSAKADKIQLLQIHTGAVHHDGGTARLPPGVRAKMDPPKIQLGVDQQTWDQFLARWNIFKKPMGVDNTILFMVFQLHRQRTR